MPWPRLKMWPGRPAARSQNVFGAGLQFLPVGEEQNRIEVALHGSLDSPVWRQPSSSGMRQSRPITSAPVSCMDGSSVALSVPK